jgi:hypothetical protein
MAVEKIMTPRDLAKAETTEEEVTVEVLNPEAVSVETEDGGMIIDFTGEQVEDIISGGFDANLAEEIEEGIQEYLYDIEGITIRNIRSIQE